MQERYDSVDKLKEYMRSVIDPDFLDTTRLYHIRVDDIPDTVLYDEMVSCGFDEDFIIGVFKETFNSENDGLYSRPTVIRQYNSCLDKVRMMKEYDVPADKVAMRWFSDDCKAGRYHGGLKHFTNFLIRIAPVKSSTDTSEVDVEKIKKELPDYLAVFLE